MYALLFPLLLGQCGPNGCSVAPDRPNWEPMVVARTDQQPAVFDVEVVPQDGQIWFDDYAVQLFDGKGHIQTPSLEPGWRYRYRVTARWGDTQRQWILSFSPGQAVRVVLPRDEPASLVSGSTTGTGGTSAAQQLPPASIKPAQSPPLSTTPDTAGQAAPSTGPGAAPALPVVEQDGTQNFGIDRSGLNGSAERITLGGREITRSEATQILQAGSLTDDSGKLRLTVIGTEADRRRVLDDLKGPLVEIAGQCLVQDYPPEHWAVAKAGFYTAGKPTIYVQSPGGQVLHRQDDYNDGPEGLRRAFEHLRKPDPNYQPDKDRDLRRPAKGLLSRLFEVLTHPFRVILSWLLAALVVCILIVLVMRGWLFYLLGLLVNLVPRPPQTPGPQTRQKATRPTSAASKTRRTR